MIIVLFSNKIPVTKFSTGNISYNTEVIISQKVEIHKFSKGIEINHLCNNEYHRYSGPARILYNLIMFMQKGMIHRTSGPAYISLYRNAIAFFTNNIAITQEFLSEKEIAKYYNEALGRK